jgi:hypothetical protein
MTAAVAQPPTPSDPESMAMGHLPGAFPTTVTAANMRVEQFTPAELGGAGSDNLRVSFPASGPIKWTESRHNEGDIALLIGPEMPSDPSYFPPTTFVDNYQPLSGGQPFENTTLAWRVNQQTGALLATVNHNGINYGNDFTYLGSPVGTIHGIAYFNQTGAQGWGFRMNDGEFRNGGNFSSDLQMGIAGFEDSRGEGNTSAAVAYFSYQQGWTGAWVNNGPGDGEATFAASSPGLAASTVNWFNGVATVRLPNVNSATDGMLFVAPTNSDNVTNIAAARPVNGGWDVAVREDENADFSGQTIVDGTQNSFQFLYVPYTATNLVGGHVNGANGTLISSAGNMGFNLTRTGAGQYSLSINGPGPTKRGENDGMLILSVAGALPNSDTLPDRKFMSYQYDNASGDFIIQSRELTATNDPANSQNQFGDVLSLRDVDFYFAWVSFTNPLALGISGDYNNNGTVDAADYVVWRENLNASVTLPNDTTPGTVQQADYDVWRANFGRSSTGALGASVTQGVPEPASLLLSAISLGLIAAAWRAMR